MNRVLRAVVEIETNLIGREHRFHMKLLRHRDRAAVPFDPFMRMTGLFAMLVDSMIVIAGFMLSGNRAYAESKSYRP